MKVDEATAQALRESIAHWERMTTGDRIGIEGLGAQDCALCRLFHFSFVNTFDCQGCPVAEDTKLSGCNGTPYVQANRLYFSLDSPKFYRAACAELRYLCELAGRLGVDLD